MKPQIPSLALDARREKAAWLIANGAKQVEAADKVGVTKQTVTKWMSDKAFTDRLEQLRTDIFKQADEILEQSIVEAAQAVVDIASGNATADDPRTLNARLRAALWVLDRFKTKKGAPAKSKQEEERDFELEMTSEAELVELLEKGKDD